MRFLTLAALTLTLTAALAQQHTRPACTVPYCTPGQCPDGCGVYDLHLRPLSEPLELVVVRGR